MAKTHSRIHSSPVAEGVRIQVGTATAFAVRKASKDVALRIRRERRPVRDAMERVPFLRGMVRLVGGAADFMDGIAESAELEPQAAVRGSRAERRFAELFRAETTSLAAFGSALAILLLIGMVWAVPYLLERFVLAEAGLSRAGCNAVACAARVFFALAAAALIPQLRVVNRLCMYRGAINQVINARADHRGQVTREAAEKASHLSRRSDAAFALTVLVLSIIAFALVRTFTLPVQLLVRILIILAIAGVIGEPIHWLENVSPKKPLSKLLAPQVWLEKLFVRKPNAQMVEVAVYAWNAARENDR